MVLMQRQVNAESGVGSRESGAGGRLASTVRADSLFGLQGTLEKD